MTSGVVVGAKLRGKLRPEGLAARGLASYAFELCPRSSALSAVGVSSTQAVEAVYGEDRPVSGVSPLAVQTGTRFEWRVTKDNAALLVKVLREGGLLGEDVEPTVRDLSSGAAEEDRLRAEADTLEALVSSSGPMVLLQAAVSVAVAGVTHTVNPDLVWRASGTGPWIVGEIKSYLDRDGLTDGFRIAGAVRQAAVGVVAVRRAVPGVEVSGVVDLVLARHGRNGSSVRRMAAEAEIVSVSTALDAAGAVADQAFSATGGAALDTREALEAVPHIYTPECHGRCELADRCRAEAAGRGMELAGGAAVAEVVRLGLTTLDAEALAAGEAVPADPAEAAVARILRAGWEAAT